jgi:hypothetical protein
MINIKQLITRNVDSEQSYVVRKIKSSDQLYNYSTLHLRSLCTLNRRILRWPPPFRSSATNVCFACGRVARSKWFRQWPVKLWIWQNSCWYLLMIIVNLAIATGFWCLTPICFLIQNPMYVQKLVPKSPDQKKNTKYFLDIFWLYTQKF